MHSNPFNCGMEAVIDLVGGKWKLLILFHLMKNERLRFGELKRNVTGVSEKMLIQQLKEMTRDGLVSRIDFHTVPPHVEYELADFGKGLASAMRPLCEWGTENMDDIVAVSAARNAPAQ